MEKLDKYRANVNAILFEISTEFKSRFAASDDTSDSDSDDDDDTPVMKDTGASHSAASVDTHKPGKSALIKPNVAPDSTDDSEQAPSKPVAEAKKPAKAAAKPAKAKPKPTSESSDSSDDDVKPVPAPAKKPVRKPQPVSSDSSSSSSDSDSDDKPVPAKKASKKGTKK